MKGNVDYTLDVRGLISPFSLLKASQVFQRMKPRQVLEIRGCDSDMQRDLLRLLPDASCEIVHADLQSADTDNVMVRVKKKEYRGRRPEN